MRPNRWRFLHIQPHAPYRGRSSHPLPCNTRSTSTAIFFLGDFHHHRARLSGCLHLPLRCVHPGIFQYVQYENSSLSPTFKLSTHQTMPSASRIPSLFPVPSYPVCARFRFVMCRALVSFNTFVNRADNVIPCDEPCAVFPAWRFLRTHNLIEDGGAAVGRRSNGRYPPPRIRALGDQPSGAA